MANPTRSVLPAQSDWRFGGERDFQFEHRRFGDTDPGPAIWRYARLLWQHKVFVATTAILAGAAAFGLSLLQTPVFEAQSVLEVQDRNENFLNLREIDPASVSDAEASMQAQIHVLESRSIASRVVERLSLDDQLEAVSAPPTLGQSLLERLSALGLEWLSSSLLFAEGDGRDAEEAAGRTRQALVTMKELVEAREKEATENREQAIAHISNGLEVEQLPQTRIIEVRFEDPDPRFASLVVNTLVEEYVRETMDAQLAAAQRTGELLHTQLTEARQSLEDSERELREFAQTGGIVLAEGPEGGRSITTERLSNLQSNLSEARAARIAAEAAYERAQGSPADALPRVVGDERLRELMLELVDVRRHAAGLQHDLLPGHPELNRVLAELETLETAFDRDRRNIVASLRNEYETAARREQLLSEAYDEEVSKVSKRAAQEAEVAALQREVASNRALYDSLLQMGKAASLASTVRASNMRVIEVAEPPHAPVRPRLLANTALGSLAGVLLGSFLVLVRAVLNRTLQTPGAISRQLNVVELGAIPELRTDRKIAQRPSQNRPADAVRPPPELVGWQNEQSWVADSFRSTLTSILLALQCNHDPLAFVVTSPQSGDGKTTVVSNLALALAEIGHRTLLIDSDLRRPSLHKLFGLRNDFGLGNMLAEFRPIQEYPGSIMYREPPMTVLDRQSSLPLLFVMVAGAHSRNAASLLASPRLGEVLARMRSEFDAVLIDTTPAFLPDARRVASVAGAAILVCRAFSTIREEAMEVSSLLAQDGTRVIGGVLNGWHMDRKARRHYSSYMGYGKGYQ